MPNWPLSIAIQLTKRKWGNWISTEDNLQLGKGILVRTDVCEVDVLKHSWGRLFTSLLFLSSSISLDIVNHYILHTILHVFHSRTSVDFSFFILSCHDRGYAHTLRRRSCNNLTMSTLVSIILHSLFSHLPALFHINCCILRICRPCLTEN